MTRCINEHGSTTTFNNPNRLVWVGTCGFWTDDWSKLNMMLTVPVCPVCGAMGVGEAFPYIKWIQTAEGFAKAKGFMYYVEWLLASKNQCGGNVPSIPRYKKWLTG